MPTYYVGSGGSDAAAGTSWALRWATIGKALGAAGIASGDTTPAALDLVGLTAERGSALIALAVNHSGTGTFRHGVTVSGANG